MKLTAQQIEEVKSQTGTDALAERHPAMDDLKSAFGEHTFYLDQAGLYVWEPFDEPEGRSQSVRLVKLASWADEQKTALQPHPPEPKAAEVSLTVKASGSEEA